MFLTTLKTFLVHARLSHLGGVQRLSHTYLFLTIFWRMIFVSLSTLSTFRHDLWMLYVATLDGWLVCLNICIHMYLSGYCGSSGILMVFLGIPHLLFLPLSYAEMLMGYLWSTVHIWC